MVHDICKTNWHFQNLGVTPTLLCKMRDHILNETEISGLKK